MINLLFRAFALITAFVIMFNVTFINVYAVNIDKNYGYTLEEAREIVLKHENIYTSAGNLFFSYSKNTKNGKNWTSSNWHNTYTDDELINILSSSNVIEYSMTKMQYDNFSAKIVSALGYITNGASSAILEILSNDNSFIVDNVSVDDNGNLNIDSEGMNKIRDLLRDYYEKENGIETYAPTENEYWAKVKQMSEYFEYSEDVSDFYAKAELYDAVYIENNQRDSGQFFDLSQAYYFVFVPKKIKLYYGGSIETVYILQMADKEGNIKNLYDYDTFHDCDPSTIYWNDNEFAGVIANFDSSQYWQTLRGYRSAQTLSGTVSKKFSVLSSAFSSSVANVLKSDIDTLSEAVEEFDRYSKGNGYLYRRKPLTAFKSYEDLFNYLHGDGAYIASKFYEDQIALQMDSNALQEDTNAKLEEIYNAIKEGYSNTASSDDFQKLIDDTVASIDKVVDNTEETNNKLSELIDLVKEQNETLLELLGVTKQIQTSVENIEAMTQAEVSAKIKEEAEKIANVSKGKFPFSIPFDIYTMFSLLAADPEPPQFKCYYGAVFGPSFVDPDNPPKDDFYFVIDFSYAQSLSDVSRGFLSLIFCSYLLSLTRKMFFNGGKLT